MNHYRTIQTSAHNPQDLQNLTLLWLARALGIGLLLGMAALWIGSIFQHLN